MTDVVQLVYIALFGLTAVSCFIGAWRARHVVDRDTRVGLVAVFVLSGLWAAATVTRVATADLTLSLWLRLAGLVVGLSSVGAWLYFASAYAGHDYHRRPGVRRVVGAGFGVAVLLKLTTPVHGLYFTYATAGEPFPHLAFQPGVGYWFLAGLTYALVGIGLFWLFDSIADSHVDTGVFRGVLVCTAAPALLDIAVYLRDVPPAFLEVSYAPLGMAVFALGTLAATDSEFRPVPQFWRERVLRELHAATVVVDAAGVVRYVSPAAVDLFPELAGGVNRSFREHCPTLYEQTRDDGSVFERRRDGARRYYRATARALAAGGSPAGRVYAYTDVTESQRTEQRLERSRLERQRFRYAVESAGHAIFLTATDGTIEYVNPAFESITGYDREEAVGQTPKILNSGEMSDQFFDRLWETILDGESWEREIINQRKDGGLYHAHQTIAPVTDDGDIDAFVSIQTDISDRKDREQQLRVLGRVLRHNIRNDMNVIRGRAELFRDGDVSDAQAQGAKIVEQSDRLLETTRKEQAITKVLLDSPNPTTIALHSLLERVVADVHTDHPEAAFSLECPSPVYVVAVGRLEVALEELLTNAVIHSDAASPTVALTVSEGANAVRIAVRDHGPHIPAREREVLSHGSTVDELFHGTGLGLWVVYWIVKQSNGSVTVATREPAGNTVTVELQPGSR